MSTHEQEAYILNHQTEPLSLANFVADNKELIASTIPNNRDFREYWSLLFKTTARKHGKSMISCSPDWASVCFLYVTNLNFSSHRENTTPSRPSATRSSDSNTTTTTTTSYLLKPDDKKKIEEMFGSIMRDKNKLWHLKTGTIVEEKMKQHGLKCNFEHPCHSLIFDPWDETWSQYFTEDELDEIISYNKPNTLSLPLPLQEYIDKFIHTNTLDEIRDILIKNPFHPLNDPELHWMETSISKALDLLYYDTVHKYQSEADLMKRIWCFIDCAFDTGEVKSSSLRRNINRIIPGIDSLQRKKTGSKVDLLFTTKINELGAAEAGKQTDTNTTKATMEYGIKTPKVLKDMLYDAVERNVSSLRDIRTFGFIIAGLEILPMVMDCPRGTVCRINRSSHWHCFPTTARNFKNRMEALFRMVYSTKTSMQIVLDKLDDKPMNVSFVKHSSPIPPSFTPSVEVSKKRKVPKTDSAESSSSST
ncbi:hypothetical protein BDC45DRAFT_610521 [Circinella umbellata]|nr:hypothetical protein BDC45DRAFT_610521 [Circinella umbellata]